MKSMIYIPVFWKIYKDYKKIIYKNKNVKNNMKFI